MNTSSAGPIAPTDSHPSHGTAIPDYLSNFLEAKPGRYQRPSSAAPSRATKPPTWFDLHLHEDLRLKRTAILPDFVDYLSRFLDPYITRSNSVYRLGTKPTTFPDIAPDEDHFIVSENNVASAVASRTIDRCALVASTLLFDLPSWSRVFTSSERAHNVTQPVARADRFIFPYLAQEPGHNKSLSPADKNEVDLLSHYGLQNFLLYEFKNLDAGHLDTMKYILGQTGDFDYAVCDGPTRCGGMHQIGSKLAVTGHEVGPDARYEDLFTFSQPDAGAAFDPALTGYFASEASSPYLDAIAEEAEEEEDVFQSTMHTPHLNTQARNSQGVPGSSSVRPQPKSLAARKKMNRFIHGQGHPGRGKNPSALATSQPFSSLDGPKKQEKMRMKARHIIQQTWAELVYNDATFLVLSSGNYEIICMRHRETQSLYFSPILRPTDPTDPIQHNATITSLIILSYRDAVDRAWQQHAMLLLPKEVALPPLYSLSFDSSGVLESAGDPLAEAVSMNQDLEEELMNAKAISCKIPKAHYRGTGKLGGLYEDTICEPYDHSHWRTIFRSPKKEPNILPTRRLCLKVDSAMDTVLLDLRSRRRYHISNTSRIVYYRLVRVGDDGEEVDFYSGHLVMKFAFGNDASKTNLQQEYDNYVALRNTCAAEILPKIFGIWSFKDSNSLGLLMECSGMSLDFWSHQPTRDRQRVIDAHRTTLTKALDPLHNAGWVHRGLTNEHIIVSRDGKPTIISLQSATPYEPVEWKTMSQSDKSQPRPEEDASPSFEARELLQWL